ncbi:hypothetical protein ACIGW3_26225 [Streptomyces sp. NPDC053499]|uniref:hypothetical protein n=1 Tax=Streptomyces sp. NPDC053499 TaxID=3365707 RepID=UPI0037D08FFA
MNSHQPHPQPPRKKRTGLKVTLGVVGALAVFWGIGTAVGDNSDDSDAKKPDKQEAAPKDSDSPTEPAASSPANPSASSSPDKPRLTAKAASNKLADATGVTTLGNPADNTGFCEGDKDHPGCRQLITTDTVSIYEFPSVKVADHWTETMRKTNKSWRQVDRFALAWNSRDQALTSKERRDELTGALKQLLQ